MTEKEEADLIAIGAVWNACTCSRCEKPFRVLCDPRYAKWINKCDACNAELEAARLATEASALHQQRVADWERFCPPEFLETIAVRVPLLAKHREVQAWTRGKIGLLLTGPTGRGKSRAAWELAKREFMLGRSVKTMECGWGMEYARTFRDSMDASQDWVAARVECDLLLMDDAFKTKFTETAETAMFEIVTIRTQQQRPIIITSNDSNESLKVRMTEDRGEPFVRRLRQYCKTISFE